LSEKQGLTQAKRGTSADGSVPVSSRADSLNAWQCPPDHIPLEKRTVDVWRASLSTAAPPKNWLSCLAPDELARAERIKIDDKRAQFIQARGLLRHMLARHLACTPEELRFEYTQRGRPYLQGPNTVNGIDFNLSHAHNWMVCAVTLDHRLGVDVERIDANPQRKGIAKRFFSPDEVQAIEALPEELRDTAFFRAWCTKEAVLKAIGTGLAGHLKELHTEIDPRKSPCVLSDDRSWILRPIETAPGYDGVCAVQTEADIHWRFWDFPDATSIPSP
jgi:4'-phosphopantetheinyl transferase